MPTHSSRLLVTAVTSAAALALVLSAPAVAAPTTCAPDAWEPDSAANRATAAAPIAVGGTQTRAICQAPNPFPRTEAGQDDDSLVFTAPGGKAYSGRITSVGSALGPLGAQGGLEIGGVTRIESSGSLTAVASVYPSTFERFTTPVLPAGRYLISARTMDTQIYPDNTMDIKTVEGDAGRYTIALAESAPAPTVAAVTLASSAVKGGSTVSGSYTLSGAVPEGGIYVFSDSTDRFAASPSTPYAAAGTTRASFTVATTRVSRDTAVTISVRTAAGVAVSVPLTIRK